MTFLLLLAALAVTGLGAWMSRRGHFAGQVLLGLGGVGLIGVIAVQVRQNLLNPQPRVRNRYEMAVSFRLANCLLEDMAGQSGSVILLFPQRSAMSADAEQNYEEGFVPPLRRGRAKLTLKAVHLEGPNRDLSAFKQALANAQGAMAVMSYAGAPAGFETLLSPGQPGAPPFYVLDADGTTDWLPALKAGRIKAVVVPRPGVAARDWQTITGMPETVFDQYYLLATPANADEVAAALKPHK
jgi:hypothetical protein